MMEGIEYEIKIIEGQILKLVITGKQTAEVATRIGKEISAIAKERGIRKYLIDITRVIIMDSVSDSFDFMNNLDRIGIERTDLLAIIYAQQPDKHLFAEDVGTNRGWNIRYFVKKKFALDWLKENDSPH